MTAVITPPKPSSPADAPVTAGTGRRRTQPSRRIVTVVVVVVVGFAIFYPLLRLVLLAFQPAEGEVGLPLVNVFTSATFWNGLVTSLAIVIPAAAIALIVGAVMAWANTRTNASLGLFGQIIPLSSFVIPHIAITAGWLVIGAPNVGLLSRWIPFFPNLYSAGGIIFVISLTLVPFTFLILQNALSNLDPALEEASLTSGASTFRTLVRVSLPATAHAIGGAGLLAVIVGLGDYTVVFILGTSARIQTLSLIVVQLVTASYPARLGDGAVIGLVLLVITATVWIVYFRVSKGGRISQIGGKASNFAIMRLGKAKWPVRAITLLYFLLATVLPVIGLIVVSFQTYFGAPITPQSFTLGNFQATFSSPLLWPSITNSAIFAAIGALIITIIIGFLTSAAKITRVSSATFGLSMVKVPSAIAPLVLAIGVLIAFFGPPFNLGGTAVLLVGTYVVLFLPHASILGESATAQVRQELIEASDTSGATWWRTQRSILGPLTAPAFVTVYALTFALIAAETSASRILARPGTEVAGFTMLQVVNEGEPIGTLAVLAVLLAALNLIVVGGLAIVTRNLRRRW
jgi:iron(III) transport system permease protein